MNYTSFLHWVLDELLVLMWLINEMHASAWTSLCRLYTDMHTHAHHTCRLSSICGRKPRQWMLWLCHFISLYLLGPSDNTDPPLSPQMRPFPPKQEAQNIHAIDVPVFSSSISLGELLVRRTMLRFWIECQTNFLIAEDGSDSSTNYTLFLKWLINEMQASAWTTLCRLYKNKHAHAHMTHAAYRPFMAESLCNGCHGCATH